MPEGEGTGVLRGPCATGVCEKSTPPETKTCMTIGIKNTKSRAGEQFLLLLYRGKAGVKGLFVHRHRYHPCIAHYGYIASASMTPVLHEAMLFDF